MRTKNKSALLIFLLALAVRLISIDVTNHHVEGDGAGRYVPAAVKLYQGQMAEALKYTSSFVYPAFLAVIYTIFGEYQTPYSQASEPIQTPVMIAQAVTGALACAIFYLTFSFIFCQFVAFMAGICGALYLPGAVWTTIQIRSEILSFFLISVVGLVFTLLVRNGSLSRKHRFAISLALGFSLVLLTLNHRMYAGLIFFVVFTLILFPHSLPLKNRIIFGLIPLIISFFLLSFLWQEVIPKKNESQLESGLFGFDLLHSVMQMNSILIDDGLIDAPFYYRAKNDEPGELYLTVEQLKILGMTVDDGLYSLSRIKMWPQRSDKILGEWAVKLILKHPIVFGLVSLKRVHMLWVEDLWVTQHNTNLKLRPSEDYRKNRQWGLAILSMLGYLIGVLALPGIFIFWRHSISTLAILFYVILLLCILHTHTAYALAVHPYILLYSISCLVFLWFWVIKKNKYRQSVEKILL